ncbi:A52R family protein [Swinepox virus]|uniref:A52R family protein n=1 Tax=Swinepox virus TaxID=10276 RepID=A0A881SXW6_SWPV|nr:A52R family protein [Swinepox virus]QQG31642.1 A52R family protein [Swinepox virus]
METNYIYRNDFFDNDDITMALLDYLYWSCVSYRCRDPAGKLFAVFESFKRDAEFVFGENIIGFVKYMFLDSIHGFSHSKSMISTMLKKENCIRESCAVVGLLARAAAYWGGDERPTSASTKVLLLLKELLTDNELKFVKTATIVRLKKYCYRD